MNSTTCERIQRTLIDTGPGAFRDDEQGRAHLVECSDCFAFLEAMGELSGVLGGAPAIDAPDALVAQTLAAVRAQAGTATEGEVPEPTVAKRDTAEEASRQGWLSRGKKAMAAAVRWPLGAAAWLLFLPGRLLRALWKRRPGAPSKPRWRWLSATLIAAGGLGGVSVFGALALLGLGALHEAALPAPEAALAEPSAKNLIAQKKQESESEPAVEEEPLRQGRRRLKQAAQKPKADRKRLPVLAARPPAPAEAKPTLDLNALVGGGSGSAIAGLGSQDRKGAAGEGAGVDLSIADQDEAPTTVPRPQRRAKPRLLKQPPKPDGRRGPQKDRFAEFADEEKEEAEDDRDLDVGGSDLENQIDDSLGRPTDGGPARTEGPGKAPPSRSVYGLSTNETGALETVARPSEAVDLTQNPSISSSPRKRGSRRASTSAGLWMPAFAGMTAGASAGRKSTPSSGRASTPSTSTAQAFLSRYAALEGIRLRDAAGYWKNTYVPGDPDVRLLQMRLLARDRDALRSYAHRPLRLEDSARQTTQPFDAPEASALAVYMHTSELGALDRRRMILQVGIRATPRFSGRRPAMNIGIVLDLRGTPDKATADRVRALLAALNKARDIGDRFALIVAGKPGGRIVRAEDFRHGPLIVASRQLFGQADAHPGPTLSLPEALDTAYRAVSGDDDPSAPLGSSSVLLVATQSLGAELPLIEPTVHAQAVEGIPMSVVGLGGAAAHAELDRLTLAGQGNRRLLESAGAAEDLVRRELSAVSRVVARAVRLRIRLAAGVQLVDVLGSYRLDEQRAQQVRDAERSIDQRLARNLGLTADRGDDEEGIQMVIPSFHAGDSHVILLDVVVPGPGALADVTVRYKDLVYLNNGVARDNVTVERREGPRGPLERNVIKNLLAHHLSSTLVSAGSALASGDSDGARTELMKMRDLFHGMRHAVTGLYADRDMQTDIAMLDEYIGLLGRGAAEGGAGREHIVDSMRLSGLRKILPRPTGE